MQRLDLPFAPDQSLAFPAWGVQGVSGSFATTFRLSSPAVFALN